MRVAVVGSGGLGGYFGGVLARSGVDVTFLTRGASLEALRTRGLQVRSVLSGNFALPVKAVDDPGTLGTPDIILLTMKAYDLEAAAQSIAPAVGGSTTLITMQNGIDHVDRLARHIPRERIVPGVVYISSTVVEPGVIDQVGGPGTIIIGEDRGNVSARVEEIQRFLTNAGLSVHVSDQIWELLWTKFMTICAMSGVTALTRLTLREIFDIDESRTLYLEVMEEVAEVARASGVDLPSSAAAATLQSLMNMPSLPLRGSMAYDLLAGRRLELDVLNGTVVRYGERLGVPTPMNRAISLALKPFANGATAPPQ
ncbi:MAG: 2-dehydropantoate 2-reductase [Thermomicrobiales bacterium]